jgi:PII interaction protein X
MVNTAILYAEETSAYLAVKVKQNFSVNNHNSETYLNHPTFGLLYRVCLLKDNQELFTTLYAQRLFFVVTITPNNLTFEPVSRSDARLLVESRLRQLRSSGDLAVYQQLQTAHKNIFQ